MVRAVAGDESLDAAVDAIIAESQRGAQVGLLIGHIGSSRDSILGLVRTPVKEDGSETASLVVSSRKNSRNSVDSVAIDVDWVAEHARQVSRMLLGGLHVAGVYCLAPENALKQSSSILCQVCLDLFYKSYGICVQVAKAVVAASSNTKAFSETLVLHISTSPRRISCRVCSMEHNGTLSLKPCDWKLAKLIPNMQSLACTYVFDVSLPISSATGSFKDILDSWIDLETQQLEAAEVLVDGVLVESNSVLSTSDDGVRDVELLLPFHNPSKNSKGSSQILGTIKLKGAVHARAYAFPREPFSNAVLGIKKDIMASFRSRLELICEDESEDKSAPLLSGGDNPEFTCLFPRRVLFPWKNTLFLCDYVMPRESAKDVEGRCKDLLATDLDLELIVWPEDFYTPRADPVTRHDDISSSSKIATSKNSKVLTGAWLAALVSIILALILLLIKR